MYVVFVCMREDVCEVVYVEGMSCFLDVVCLCVHVCEYVYMCVCVFVSFV